MTGFLFFQNLSWLGALLPVVAIPVAIHLLNKKFPKVVPFPSIEMVKKSAAQRSKLFKMRHLILLIVRTLALILLILCFLKPFQTLFGLDPDKKGERAVVVILDQSLSMNYKGGGISSRERAIIELEKIIDSLENSDLVNLVTLEKAPRLCFRQSNNKHGELLSFARSLKPGISHGDITGAISLASSQVKKIKAPRKEIFFISDFQRSNWGRAEFNNIPADVRLFFVDVSAKILNNKTILSAAVLNSTIIAGDEVTLDIKLANYSDEKYEDRLALSVDNSNEYYQDFKISPWSLISTRVSIPIPTTGIHELKLSIKEDDLPQDNFFYVSLNALDKEEVLIVSDEEESPTAGNYFLSSALNPYPEDKGTLMPRKITSDDLSPIHLATSTKIFISGIQRLSPDKARLLVDFMSKGGSILYYMDGVYDAGNIKILEKEMPAEMPFHAGAKQTSKNIPGGSIKIRRGSFDSKFLKLFAGRQKSQLANIDFYEYYHTRATGQGKVLLKYAEGTPAMGSCRVGLGQLVLCNFSLAEMGSNLAGKRLFPVWIHEMNRALSRENRKLLHYEAGETVNSEVWIHEISGNSFRKPDGSPMKVKSSRVNDDRLAVSFKPLVTGHFNLQKDGRTLYSFPVNCSADEADLRKIAMNDLPSRSKGAAYTLSGTNSYETLDRGKPVYHWFLLSAIGLLTIELFFFSLFRRLSS